MTHNELITELLKYDGWEITKLETATRYRLFIGDELDKSCHLFNFVDLNSRDMLYAYLTDMNILHRISVKVHNELNDLYSEMLANYDFVNDEIALSHIKEIAQSIFSSPNPQGEHLQLAEAIVNAIRYISANKA